MRILELYSGTESISKEFRERGHEAFTIEIIPTFHPDLVADVMDLTIENIDEYFPNPDIVWASPPCDTYSIAACSTHRERLPDGRIIPRTEKAAMADELVIHTLNLIRSIDPDFWFMENPVGMLRRMEFMKGIPRATVTYCQYGDTRRKPTDIFSNRVFDIRWRKNCSNGDSCHDEARRGAKTGTQGLKGKVSRSVIPSEFGIDLCRQLEDLEDGIGTIQSTIIELV